MATAAEYRKWPKNWAREASDENVRESYAKMGQLWLQQAARAERMSSTITPPEPKIATDIVFASGADKP